MSINFHRDYALRGRQIKMQSAYSQFKHPNILGTSDELSRSNFWHELTFLPQVSGGNRPQLSSLFFQCSYMPFSAPVAGYYRIHLQFVGEWSTGETHLGVFVNNDSNLACVALSGTEIITGKPSHHGHPECLSIMTVTWHVRHSLLLK